LHPDEVLRDTGADYVFAGDAEITFGEFIAGKSIGKIIAGKLLAVLEENVLNWDLLKRFEGILFDSLYFTGGRGCPGICTFCTRLHGSAVRIKPAKQIIQEIRDADRLTAEGKLTLTKWQLYKNCGNSKLQNRLVSWCSVFDEDFFLDRKRAVMFLQLFEFFRFQERYRLNFQTNPCSLLDKSGKFDGELFYWFKRLKPMIQIGAETFHPQLLKRWKKRHNAEQLETVLDALDKTDMDYNVFYIWTDYHSTFAEITESAELLIASAQKHRQMRIASTPFMIPLYGTEIQRDLEKIRNYRGKHWTDYEVAHPELLPKEVAELAEMLDEMFQDAFYLEKRQEVLKTAEKIIFDKNGKFYAD
ncbi:MAG: radical SAM protein, partial [Planctomycetaceae bacterium]|nr:radical SAM protein [Planctomycetaceae bacterium]